MIKKMIIEKGGGKIDFSSIWAGLNVWAFLLPTQIDTEDESAVERKKRQKSMPWETPLERYLSVWSM